MIKLLNCPFCGGVAEFALYTINKKSNGEAVRCSRCGAETMKFVFIHDENPILLFKEVLRRADKCKEQAAESWNKRYELK
jgi:transcription elongation factor Elf1